MPPTHDRARIEAYTGPDFSGAAITLDRETASLRGTGYNDRIQSMRIYGNSWEACEHENFGGSCLVFGAGDYRRLPAQIDRAISSLRPINREPSWGGLTPAGSNFVVLPTGAQRTRRSALVV